MQVQVYVDHLMRCRICVKSLYVEACIRIYQKGEIPKRYLSPANITHANSEGFGETVEAWPHARLA